jgi:hypothetical protein
MQLEQEEMEYRVPAKLLNSRDPVILNKLSMGEAAQWFVFGVLIYFTFNSPLDFTFKLVIGTLLFMAGLAFIHSPINGLAGIEWSYIYLRFNVEKRQHQTEPPLEAVSQKPLVSVSGKEAKPLLGDTNLDTTKPELDKAGLASLESQTKAEPAPQQEEWPELAGESEAELEQLIRANQPPPAQPSPSPHPTWN